MRLYTIGLLLMFNNVGSLLISTSQFRLSNGMSQRFTKHILYQQNIDGDDRFGEKYQELGRKRIDPSKKKEYLFIGPNDDKAHTPSSLIQYFVPGFVFIWAAGYGAVFLAELQGNGLGDQGGFIGVGFTVFLLFALFGAAAYEIFKPDTA